LTFGITADPYHLCNDLTTDGLGNVYATDSFAGYIYRLDPFGNFTVWSNDPFYKGVPGVAISLNGIAYHKNGYIIVGRYDTSQFFKINIQSDGSAGLAVPVLYEPGVSHALSPDGIRFVGDGSRLMVMNASGAVLLRTENDWQTIAEASPRFDNLIATPSGIMANGRFYLLESDLASFFAGLPVSNYSLIELSNDAIPGLYDSSDDKGWIIAVVILGLVALLVLIIGVILLLKKQPKAKEYA